MIKYLKRIMDTQNAGLYKYQSYPEGLFLFFF